LEYSHFNGYYIYKFENIFAVPVFTFGLVTADKSL